MKLINTLYEKHRNLILYGIIGSLSAGIDFITYVGLNTYLEVPYLTANFISVTCGISMSFYLNRTYNFKVSDKSTQRLILFFTIGFGGLLASTALLHFFMNYTSLSSEIAKILSIVLVVFFQFLLNKFVTFKK